MADDDRTDRRGRSLVSMPSSSSSNRGTSSGSNNNTTKLSSTGTLSSSDDNKTGSSAGGRTATGAGARDSKTSDGNANGAGTARTTTSAGLPTGEGKEGAAGASTAAAAGGAGDHAGDAQRDNFVIVIDIGTGGVKAGWANEDAPRCVIPTLVLDSHSQPLPALLSPEASSSEHLVGHEAIAALHASTSKSGAVTLNNPVERGLIRNWTAITVILEHIYKKELRVNPKEHPVLLSFPPLADRDSRAQLASLMFKKFGVPSLCVVNQATLSLFASGRTTGIVLECGDGVTWAVPIFQGLALPHAIRRLPCAGSDLTATLMSALHRRGVTERGVPLNDSHMDIVRDIKEKLCAVRPTLGAARREEKTDNGGDEDNEGSGDHEGDGVDTARASSIAAEALDRPQSLLRKGSTTISNEMASAAMGGARTDDGSRDYELPDGEVITLDEACRYDTTELMFDPTRGGFAADVDGVHQMILKSIMMCDGHLRVDLFRNIVLTGGTTMFAGFAERVKRELLAIIPDGVDEVAVFADSQRKYATWIGGSIFASLPTFGSLKITAKEWAADEEIVHKKFF